MILVLSDIFCDYVELSHLFRYAVAWVTFAFKIFLSWSSLLIAHEIEALASHIIYAVHVCGVSADFKNTVHVDCKRLSNSRFWFETLADSENNTRDAVCGTGMQTVDHFTSGKFSVGFIQNLLLSMHR